MSDERGISKNQNPRLIPGLNRKGENGIAVTDTESTVHSRIAGNRVWQTVERELECILGERVHGSWTAKLSYHSETDGKILLIAPSKFVAGRIDDKYGDLVKSVWARHDDRVVTIGAQPASGVRKTSSSAQPVPVPAPGLNKIKSTSRSGESRREQFTFENFVVGPSNELAFAVARRVSEIRESQYNPILIHGPHGMGKTHLLYAIKAAVENVDLARQVKLISSEQFVAGFIKSVRANGRTEIEAFKSGLRNVDLLMIDDAHFIADKPGSQEELLHTLISLVDDGKQVVLASNQHPHAFAKAGKRLKSYLYGGLLCDIGPADYKLRLRILDRLIEKRRKHGHPTLTMPQNARDHLAARINATPRDLEGAFNQVVARSEFLGCALSLENVREALAHARYSAQTRPTVDKIQRTAAAHFGISIDELLSKRRARAVARPRQIAMYLCKILTTRSLPDIGRRFGGRDHTTVIHAVKRIEALRAEDKALNHHVETIIEALKMP